MKECEKGGAVERVTALVAQLLVFGRDFRGRSGPRQTANDALSVHGHVLLDPVSYTHLTLPTSDLV